VSTALERRDTVEAELGALVAGLGPSVIGDSRRSRAILSDRCSTPDRDCRREIAAVGAVAAAVGPALAEPGLDRVWLAARLDELNDSSTDNAELTWAVGCWRRQFGYDDETDLARRSRRTVLLAVGGVVLIGGGATLAGILARDDDRGGTTTTTTPVASTTTTLRSISQVVFPSTTEGPFLITRTWTITDTKFSVRAVVASAAGSAVDELHDEVVPSAYATDAASIRFDPATVRAVGTPVIARFRIPLESRAQTTLTYEATLASPPDRSQGAVVATVEQWRSEWQASDATLQLNVGDPTYS